MEVISQTGNHVTLRDIVTNEELVRHLSRLRLFNPGELDIGSLTRLALTDTNTWLVERILDHKPKSRACAKTRRKFLVKWVGFTEPTWDTYDNLKHCQKLHEYAKQFKELKTITPLAQKRR